jgi:hypothetical protein
VLSLLKSLFRNAGSADRTQREVATPDREFVAFITPLEQPHFLEKGQILESDQASMRLRVGVPAQELAKRLQVCLVPVEHVRHDPELKTLGKVRAIAVGKQPVRFFAQERERAMALLEWVESAASRHRLVVDFSDDLGAAAAMYSEPALLEFQKRLLAACHGIVPCQALKERLMPHAAHGISVIEDPYESEHAAEPRFDPGAVLRLVWFGVFGEPLRPFIEAQFAALASRLDPRPVELTFVTYAGVEALVRQMAGRLRNINPQFSLRHVPWSLKATASALASADMVVLPQDAGSEWGSVKSHNRLVESIHAGRFVVASPIPSYLELAPYAWIDSDLGAGIEWALAHPDEARRRIVQGQGYVAKRFSPAQIGAQWAGALRV